MSRIVLPDSIRGPARDRIDTSSVSVAEPIRFSDMDAYGHVNNAVYFRLFEQARMVFLQAIGLTLDLDDPGVGPILAETRCRFRIALTHPDATFVGASAREIGPHWFTMDYVVVSEQHNAVAAQGDARIVVYDYARREKCPLPDTVKAAMTSLATAT
ncbi:MAG: thioesterase family protein [Pseudomonadota bacterium]